MFNEKKQFQPAANNSNGTYTHETGIYSGNPYLDFEVNGVNLDLCIITPRRGKNRNGNRITGRFNIHGRWTTMGATNYHQLIERVVEKHREHCAYIREQRHLRRIQRRLLRIQHLQE